MGVPKSGQCGNRESCFLLYVLGKTIFVKSFPNFRQPRVTLFGTLFLSGMLAFAYLYYDAIRIYWFSSRWTTDDALQQAFPMHNVLTPGVFAEDDIVSNLILGYLPPLHYWISCAITFLTQDPILTGHWVMLIQILLTLLFFFLAVRTVGGFAPACFAVTWLMHTRPTMQRMTAGLPRGWAPVILAAYLFFALKHSNRGVIVTCLICALIHPPSLVLIVPAHGLFLLHSWLRSGPTLKRAATRELVLFALVGALAIGTTMLATRRPPEIGSIVTYEQALTMPEFSKPNGRFAFVPFRPAWDEIRTFGFRAFVTNYYKPPPELKAIVPELVAILLLGVTFIGLRRQRVAIPPQLWAFLGAIVISYFAARQFAFRLFVPDRYIDIPLVLFFCSACTLGVWRALHREPNPTSSALRSAWPAGVGLLLLASFIYRMSGDGLFGPANFNIMTKGYGHVWTWLQKNTDPHALVAGHPRFMDPGPLLSGRRAYMTAEMAYPLYTEFVKLVRHRVEVSYRAHYARTLDEVLSILEPEGIDYFVFARKEFYPEALAQANFYSPFEPLVRELASRHHAEYAFRELPATIDLAVAPYMPFRDDFAAVIDMKKLKEYRAAHAGSH